jgi:hypothetical protein
MVLTSLLVVMSFQILTSPCSAVADVEKYVWQSREQFVAISEQDGPESSTPPNDHPASLSSEQVRNALSSMVLATNDKHKQLPVFNQPEIDMLSQYIPEALHQAGPRDDVTFAIVGHFSSFADFLKVRQVTTGRVFYKDGKLNIIFGIVHRDIKENEDRRLNPLTPGSRTRPVNLEDRIMALPGEQPFSKPRQDWVVFSRQSMDEPAFTPMTPVREERGHEQMDKRPAESTIPQTEQPKTTTPQLKGKSTEERLIQLNELKNKHLITDEEYRAKRKEILDGL